MFLRHNPDHTMQNGILSFCWFHWDILPSKSSHAQNFSSRPLLIWSTFTLIGRSVVTFWPWYYWLLKICDLDSSKTLYTFCFLEKFKNSKVLIRSWSDLSSYMMFSNLVPTYIQFDIISSLCCNFHELIRCTSHVKKCLHWPAFGVELLDISA